MTKKYVHFSARDLEETVLEIHGLKPSSKSDGLLKLTECPRCGRRNSPDAVRCGYCGYVLDRELAIKIEEEERMKDEAIIKRIENLERLVHALLNASPEKLASAPQAPSTTSPNQTVEQ